jgi:signal transduction histidine kinase
MNSSHTSAVTILLVDDEPRNLDAVEAILAHTDYTLLRATDADTALRLLLNHDVAAIVLDIKMPGVSGFELAQLIKGTKRFRQIPILFLTAYMVEDQDMIAGYGAGAVDYLTKPVNPQILRHKIAVFADLFRKTRALAELNEKLEVRVQERTAELEKSEAALRVAARQKDDFLAILAHELRNPLAPLRTGLDLLMQVKPAVPRVDRTLGAMDRQLDHMVRLIDDLLDVSRINAGKLELRKERVDLAEVIDRALDSARGFFSRRHQTVAVDIPRAVMAVADSVRVCQILGNLLHNASKYTPENGTVRVALVQENGRALIQVIDSGVGLRPDEHDQIFQMFTRIERPAPSNERGLGIGLALARSLAEMHNGTLSVDSAGPGQGATFTLALPTIGRAVEPATVPNDSGGRRAQGGKLRIVLIEDDDDIADTMGDWLEMIGHSVAIARRGVAGVQLVKDVVPDVVLCDIGLPDMDGIEVCKAVRKLDLVSQPTMIAVTGWGRADDLERTKQAGFDEHLVKPVKPERLQGVLEAYAEKLLGGARRVGDAPSA